MEELAKLEEQRRTPGYVGVSSRAGKEEEKKSPVTLKRGKVQGPDRRASNEMCNFLILNISSLQLIPVNMIAYRQQYGSVNPAGIIGPAILATFVSTAVAVVYCKVKELRRRG